MIKMQRNLKTFELFGFPETVSWAFHPTISFVLKRYNTIYAFSLIDS